MDGESITLTQTGLTDRILRTINMEDYHIEYTPMDNDPTHKDLEGTPCCEKWNYHSVVGMLLYFAGSTRSDISYAVH